MRTILYVLVRRVMQTTPADWDFLVLALAAAHILAAAICVCGLDHWVQCRITVMTRVFHSDYWKERRERKEDELRKYSSC